MEEHREDTLQVKEQCWVIRLNIKFQSKWTVCSALCALWTCERSCTLQSKGWRISWGVLANVPAAGKIVRTGGLWSCSNLYLKKLVWGNKESSCGLEWCLRDLTGAGEYKIIAMLAPLCPRLILTLAVLQLYSTGDTCVLANPDCWHFHQGCRWILCWLMSLILTKAEHCPLKGAGTASSVL